MQPARPTDVQPELLETSRHAGRTTWHFRLDERTAERIGILPMTSLILGSGRTPDDRIIAARWEVRTAGHLRRSLYLDQGRGEHDDHVGRQELTDKDGVGIPLSTAEFRLLKAFLEHPGIVLTRDQLLDLTVGRTADIFDRSIDNHVSRLRKKMEEDPKKPSIIRTHWGGGYSLSGDVVAE